MSSKNDETGELNFAEFHNRLTNHVFIVHEFMKSKKSFKIVYHELYTYMKQGFEKPEVRKHPLKFKFTINPNEPIKTMEVRHFIVNMIYWHPFLDLGKSHELNDSHIYDCTCPTEKSSADFINNKIIIPYREEIDTEDINAALDDMIYMLSRINKDFALILGTTLDAESFSDMRERFSRFKELTECKLEDGMQPKEIEDLLNNNLKEFIDIIIGDEVGNNIKPFLITGAGINKGQLSQFAINGGLKPDIEGNVVPIPINSNFLYGGLNSVSNFYVDGQAGCKPLILNKTVMGRSGHFAYKTMTLASRYRLSRNTYDCHTVKPVKFEVKTKEHLKRIDKRYYVDEEDNLHRINSDIDTDLIGKTILLRDPITCCSDDGICHVCYGDLSITNKNNALHIGRFAVTRLNNFIQQRILSSKHTLRTNSTLIQFNDDFYRFFIIESTDIKLNVDSEETFKDWNLVMTEDDYFQIDDMAENNDFNYYAERFTLVNKKTGEKIEISENSSRELYFFGYVSKLIKKRDDEYTLNLDSIGFSAPIATINIENNEVSAPLKNIMKLLDNANHFGCETIDDMVNKCVQLTIDSDMPIDAVHCSVIMKGLFRRSDNILLSPDFSDEESSENYKILRVTTALLNNPSLTVSMSFESLGTQVVNPTTYNKYTPSDYDIFYRENIYDASRKYYQEKKEEKRIEKMKRKKPFHKIKKHK